MKKVNEFFSNIDRLPLGKRNVLRDEARNQFGQVEHPSTYAHFFSCLPEAIPEELESRFYFAACLHCLWPVGTTNRLPVEEILWDMARKDAQKQKKLEHDLKILLDYQWGTGDILPGKIYHLARIFKNDGYAIDCAALLDDLINWDDLKQTVQLKWSRAVYMKPGTDGILYC